MRQVLREIQDGTFARNWILENKAGLPSFLAKRRQAHEHAIEQVGDRLRSMMRWLGK
jgi:ketol-acid reductoisomerase